MTDAVIYEELRQLAHRMLGNQPHTLQPTALVHEAWMKLAKSANDVEERRHFFAVAATAMRQILVNHARDRKAQKRGGGAAQVTLDDAVGAIEEGMVDVLDLDDALAKLRELDERQARVVELRVFAGLSVEDVASALSVSPRTVKTDWRFARAWLQRELEG